MAVGRKPRGWPSGDASPPEMFSAAAAEKSEVGARDGTWRSGGLVIELRGTHSTIAAMFKNFDSNKDGTLSAQELRQALTHRYNPHHIKERGA